jgi:hypothetical protein
MQKREREQVKELSLRGVSNGDKDYAKEREGIIYATIEEDASRVSKEISIPWYKKEKGKRKERKEM